MICHVDSAAISIGTLLVALHLTICRRSISGEFVYSLSPPMRDGEIRDDEVWDEAAEIDYNRYLGDVFEDEVENEIENENYDADFGYGYL
jgi:hypothetical protein